MYEGTLVLVVVDLLLDGGYRFVGVRIEYGVRTLDASAAPIPAPGCEKGAMARLGVYDLSWSGGTFSVEIRADGVFWCRKFPTHSTWKLMADGHTLLIDWQQWGTYELVVNADGTLTGSVQGKPDDWRKATFVRALSSAEAPCISRNRLPQATARER